MRRREMNAGLVWLAGWAGPLGQTDPTAGGSAVDAYPSLQAVAAEATAIVEVRLLHSGEWQVRLTPEPTSRAEGRAQVGILYKEYSLPNILRAAAWDAFMLATSLNHAKLSSREVRRPLT